MSSGKSSAADNAELPSLQHSDIRQSTPVSPHTPAGKSGQAAEEAAASEGRARLSPEIEPWLGNREDSGAQLPPVRRKQKRVFTPLRQTRPGQMAMCRIITAYSKNLTANQVPKNSCLGVLNNNAEIWPNWIWMKRRTCKTSKCVISNW